jgi:hypothetical protein
MKLTTGFTRKDVWVGLGCALFLLAALGAVGSTGRRRAKEAVCVSNLRRWGVILQAVADDNGGNFLHRTEGMRDWVWALRPYYVNPRIRLCPEATKTYMEGAQNPFLAWEYEYYDDTDLLKGSYVINDWISDEPEEYWRTPYVREAASVPMFLDGQWREMEPHPSDEPLPYETDMWTAGPMNEMRRACLNRHNGLNGVFMDGAVRKVGLKQLWRLKWHREWPDDSPLPVWPEWMENFRDP